MKHPKNEILIELKSLKAQVNPHFLFNSLNTITALIRNYPEQAEKVTEDLADLFRFSLRSGDRPLILLGEELEAVEMYLNIERARFGKRLLVEFRIPGELKYVQIPSLTLQPLVENAVIHGASRVEGPCRIWIEAARAGKNVEVRVMDEGPGFQNKNKERLFEAGYGLKNIEQRLRLAMGTESVLEILDQGVVIRFPLYEGEHAAVETTEFKTPGL